MMKKALAHLEAGEFDEVVTICRTVLDENPHDAEAMFVLARAREQQGDADVALDLFESAGRIDPFNPNLYHAIGALHLNQHRLNEARQSFLRAVEINPALANAHCGIALVELEAGRLQAAEQAADQALSEDPENVPALVCLGTAKVEQGQCAPAIACLREAMRLDPANVNAQAQLGRAFLAAGNAAFAMQCFENTLRSRPDSPELLDYLACAQLRCGEHAKAAGNFRRALTLGRSNSAVFSGLAKCELALGNQDQAEVLMRRAIEMEPGNADIVRTFARYQLARGNAGEALELVRGLPRADEEATQLLLSGIHVALRDPAAALAVLEGRVTTGRASTETSLVYASLLEENGRQEESCQLLDAMMAQENPPVAVRLHHALQLVRQGNREGAEGLRALAGASGLSSSQRAGVLRELALALEKMGDYEGAAGTYRSMARSRALIIDVLAEAPLANREFMESGRAGEITGTWPEEPPPDGRPRPVFVFSWPGSGRERLIQALEAHPGIMMVADQPGTQARRRALISRPAGARDLTVMPEAGVRLARGRYWKDLRRGQLEPAGRVTVDAMWLPAEMLPTIARLFPEAVVLVMNRDPRDMALAWLKGGFEDLETMASAYAWQLELLQRCREALPGMFFDVDHDRLVRDPSAGLGILLGTLGLERDEAVEQRWAESRPADDVEPGEWEKWAGALEPAFAALGQPRAPAGAAWHPKF